MSIFSRLNHANLIPASIRPTGTKNLEAVGPQLAEILHEEGVISNNVSDSYVAREKEDFARTLVRTATEKNSLGYGLELTYRHVNVRVVVDYGIFNNEYVIRNITATPHPSTSHVDCNRLDARLKELAL